MTPSEEVNTSAVKAALAIAGLAGIWMFISPWVYGFAAETIAWNDWVVGVLIFVFVFYSLTRPYESVTLSWVMAVVGIWTFFSPWMYHFTVQTAHMVNSFIVGVIVFL